VRCHVDRAGLNPSTRWHQQPKQDIVAICSLVSINLNMDGDMDGDKDGDEDGDMDGNADENVRATT